MSSKAKIYLYREGNECSAITGGWEQGSKSIGTFSKSSNSFDFNVNYVKAVKSWNVAQSINLIDFSKFDRVLYDVFLSSSYEGFKSSFYIAGCNPKLDTYDDVANSKWRVTTSDIGTINSFLEFECNSSAYITIGFTIWENQSSNLTANFKNIYLETKENVISINSQNTSSINFSCNNLDNLITITKAEVYINDVLSKTYTSNFGNISYSIDNTLCTKGNNQIKIKVTYTQGDDIYETVEEVLTYVSTEKGGLPTSSSLKELIDRQELLTNAIEVQKNTLKSILESKNVVVSEGENKLSILIQKVNELENNNKLWLYRDGNECINATGGISDSHPLTNSNYTRVNVGKKSEYLSFTHNAKQQMTSCGSNSKIDLTDYKKLKIELKGNISNRPNQLLVLRFVSDINVYESTVFSADLSNLSSNKSTLEFDISNVKESLYLRIISVTTIESTSPFIDSEIYKIWLEK